MRGDADVIASGLLTELKMAGKKPPVGVTDLWQLLGYVLMVYVDEHALTDVALFSARYGYLAQWNLSTLLPKLAGRPATAAALRAEFRAALEAGADGETRRRLRTVLATCANRSFTVQPETPGSKHRQYCHRHSLRLVDGFSFK
jgi:hypothetical protein